MPNSTANSARRASTRCANPCASSPKRKVMSLVLHAHPLSSYCQKVLLGLRENGVAFDYRTIEFGDPVHAAELERLGR
jgi:hypothetical protein